MLSKRPLATNARAYVYCSSVRETDVSTVIWCFHLLAAVTDCRAHRPISR